MPHTLQVPPCKSPPRWSKHKVCSQLRATWWDRTGNPGTNPSPTSHWQTWQRCQGPWGWQRLGTPLLPARSRIGDGCCCWHTEAACHTAPQWKEAFCLNELQCRPSQNTEAFIPQAVLLTGERLLWALPSWVGWKPKAQPGINPYLIPVYNAKAKLHLKGRKGASKANASKLSTELRQQRLSDTPGNQAK